MIHILTHRRSFRVLTSYIHHDYIQRVFNIKFTLLNTLGVVGLVFNGFQILRQRSKCQTKASSNIYLSRPCWEPNTYSRFKPMGFSYSKERHYGKKNINLAKKKYFVSKWVNKGFSRYYYVKYIMCFWRDLAHGWIVV